MAAAITDDVLHALASTHFRVERLTEPQLLAIKSSLSSNNTFVFLPTGAGKTMCFYMVPIVWRFLLNTPKACIIVVSPLITLMTEQVETLGNFKHQALFICANNQQASLASVKRSPPSFIFLTPEQAGLQHVKTALKSLGSDIKLLVIDECHCVFQSSSTFRPEYQKLEFFNGSRRTPIMALTATPTVEVREKLASYLGVTKYHLIETQLDRPEIFLEVRSVTGFVHFDPRILQEIKQQPGLTLVFVQSRTNLARYFDEVFKELGVKAGLFHASLSETQKALVYSRIMERKLSCVLTTSALGMGMNLPDVRWVILLGFPFNVLDLAQQLGRAARDKKPGKATLLVSSSSIGFKEAEKVHSAATPARRQVQLFSPILSPSSSSAPPSSSSSAASPSSSAASPSSSAAPAPSSSTVPTVSTPRPSLPLSSSSVTSRDIISVNSSSSKTLSKKEETQKEADQKLVEHFAFTNRCKRELLVGSEALLFKASMKMITRNTDFLVNRYFGQTLKGKPALCCSVCNQTRPTISFTDHSTEQTQKRKPRQVKTKQEMEADLCAWRDQKSREMGNFFGPEYLLSDASLVSITKKAGTCHTSGDIQAPEEFQEEIFQLTAKVQRRK